MGKSLGQVGPSIGGMKLNFAALANPIGLATAAAGAFAAAIIGSVTKVTALEKELRPMVERSRIGAESLQILAEAANRAGSEDGLEGVTDSAQELQLQLGEIAILGSGRAKEALEALGLSAQELNDMEPEAAWRRTVEAIQQIPDVTARAALAEEVFGGTSEKLAGIVNMTTSEFAALEQQVAATADVVSEEDLANAKELTMNMNEMKASIGKAFTTLGTAVIPIINKLFGSIKEAMPVLRETFLPVFEALKEIWIDLQPTLADLGDTLMNDVLPALQDIWKAIAPVLIPALKLLVNIIGTNLKTAFDVIGGVLKVVAALLRGDFAGAWRAVQETVLKVVRNMVGLVNKFLGLFGQEIDTSGLDQALANIEAEAHDMAEGDGCRH